MWCNILTQKHNLLQLKLSICKVQNPYVCTAGFGDPKHPEKVFTEQDWTDVSVKNLDPYLKSKTLAERAAWEYVEQLPGAQGL